MIILTGSGSLRDELSICGHQLIPPAEQTRLDSTSALVLVQIPRCIHWRDIFHRRRIAEARIATRAAALRIPARKIAATLLHNRRRDGIKPGGAFLAGIFVAPELFERFRRMRPLIALTPRQKRHQYQDSKNARAVTGRCSD